MRDLPKAEGEGIEKKWAPCLLGKCGVITDMLKQLQCDETRPHCLRCVKRGITCSGYPKPQLKFKVYGPLPQLPHRDQRSTYAASFPDLVQIPEVGSGSVLRRSFSPQAAGGSRTPGLDNNSPSDWLASTGGQILFPLNSLPANYECLRILDLARFARGQSVRQGVTNSITVEKSSFTPAWPAPNSSYISYIPTRLGHSRVLDDAVVCVIHAFDAFMKDSSSVNDVAVTYYLRALKSLKQALLSEEAYSSNTLCAVMLLGVYEVSLDSLYVSPCAGSAG
jgi:hypothetical protein